MLAVWSLYWWWHVMFSYLCNRSFPIWLRLDQYETNQQKGNRKYVMRSNKMSLNSKNQLLASFDSFCLITSHIFMLFGCKHRCVCSACVIVLNLLVIQAACSITLFSYLLVHDVDTNSSPDSQYVVHLASSSWVDIITKNTLVLYAQII